MVWKINTSKAGKTPEYVHNTKYLEKLILTSPSHCRSSIWRELDRVRVKTILPKVYNTRKTVGVSMGLWGRRYSPQPSLQPLWPFLDEFYRRPGPNGDSPEDVVLSEVHTMASLFIILSLFSLIQFSDIWQMLPSKTLVHWLQLIRTVSFHWNPHFQSASLVSVFSLEKSLFSSKICGRILMIISQQNIGCVSQTHSNGPPVSFQKIPERCKKADSWRLKKVLFCRSQFSLIFPNLEQSFPCKNMLDPLNTKL